jgi:hypothetical protein
MTVRANSFVAVLVGSMAVTGGQRVPRDSAVDRAKALLAQEMSVTTDLIELVEAVEAEWRDSSLGCRERGMVYTPVITAGYRVTLGVGRDRFVVHTTSDRAVVCGRPRTPRGDSRDAKLPPTDALVGLRLSEQARADLATRLGVGKERVTVNLFRPMMWPDSSLGCPVKDQRYPQQPTRGFVIDLAFGGQSYEYHSDMTRVVTCSLASKP